MFTFYKYKQGGPNDLFAEERIAALSGYALYKGQALKTSAGALCAATTGDKVYAISNTSAASSVATAAYVPNVFPVNSKQVWKADMSTAATAATIKGAYVGISSANSTAIAGDTAGTAVYVYDIITAVASSIYVVFADVV